jgi:pantetheine-phosphate adenylyltransferase
MKKAIYPGSFDPITNGHVDIVNRACSLFDEIIIAVFNNPEKQPLFNFKERVVLINKVFQDNPQVNVQSFSGLLVDYAMSQSVFTIIRGLRAVSDFEYEFQMSLINRKLNEKLETVFLMTDEKFFYLSSSIVRQLSLFNTSVEAFVPSVVNDALSCKAKVTLASDQ